MLVVEQIDGFRIAAVAVDADNNPAYLKKSDGWTRLLVEQAVEFTRKMGYKEGYKHGYESGYSDAEDTYDLG